MRIRINELKTLIKHISCGCRCKFNGQKYNSNQKRNSDKYQCVYKRTMKRYIQEKDCV